MVYRLQECAYCLLKLLILYAHTKVKDNVLPTHECAGRLERWLHGKVFIAKPDDLNSVPSTGMVKGESQLLKVVLCPPQMVPGTLCKCLCMHICSDTHRHLPNRSI